MMSQARILLVDDDPITLDSLGSFLSADGCDVTPASSKAQAMNFLEAGRFNLLITDVSMPGGDGFELLSHVRTLYSDIAVIMITGYGTIESAVEAIKQGAWDYLTKPIIDDDVRMSVQRALQQQGLKDENRRLRAALGEQCSLGNIVGQDHRMQKVFELIDAVADSKTTVLITGESGTGKSMVARAIHAQSPRRDKPFIEVSCGAIPDTLLESELFGHVRGSFTGAMNDKEGKFAAADGGTIFLDEIACASPNLQMALLRVLQERKFEPVGGTQTREVDVRVILATNHDLAQSVHQGKFRQDLFYRVNVVNVELPPLRERIGDIPVLAQQFLRKYDAAGRLDGGISPEAITAMQRHAWPGNVRELENCIERAVVLCRSSRIEPGDLPETVTHAAAASSGTVSAAVISSLQEAMAEPERRIIRDTLMANNGSRQLTAVQLGINRCTLYKKMKKYGLLGEV